MTQLLALSFDCPTSPSIRLRGIEANRNDADAPWGWGVAWYPSNGRSAMVIKDPTSIGTNALTQVLSDWERFSSHLFVAHLRGAAKRTTQQDTHPFSRAFAGRDWVLAHNGDLRHGYREALPLPGDGSFQPIGSTDSEWVLCWLLARVRRAGARRLAEVGWDRLLMWLRQVNAEGTLNLLLSDGEDLVAYSDAFGYNPLCTIRHQPPDPLIHVTSPEVELKVGTSTDTNRTCVIFSTRALSEGAWATMVPGTMHVARRGASVWISDPLPPEWREVAALAARGEVHPTIGRMAPAPVEAADKTDAVTATNATDAVAATLAEAARTLRAPELRTMGLARHAGEHRQGEGKETRRLRVLHETVYTYAEAVQRSAHLFRLRPVHDRWQEVLDVRLTIEPASALREFEDVFGNQTHETEINERYETLRIRAESTVQLLGHRHPRLRAALRRQRIPLTWMPWQRQMMMPYLLPPELPESQLRELSDWAMSFVERQDYDLVETLKDINATIWRDFTYLPASTQLETTPFDVYVQRRGVCQDFANLFIAVARLLNIPARYRVGYVFTGNHFDNPEQGDASHAWVEVYLPGLGWRGFDPTNNAIVGHDHVRVACGRNFRDATPTAGVIYRGGGTETLRVRVEVRDADDEGERAARDERAADGDRVIATSGRRTD